MASTRPPQQPPAPTSLVDHTLRTAPLNVVYGSLASSTLPSSARTASQRLTLDSYPHTAALGAAAGAASGVVRDQPAIPAAFKTALRTGVFSFSFFSALHLCTSPLDSLSPD